MKTTFFLRFHLISWPFSVVMQHVYPAAQFSSPVSPSVPSLSPQLSHPRSSPSLPNPDSCLQLLSFPYLFPSNWTDMPPYSQPCKSVLEILWNNLYKSLSFFFPAHGGWVMVFFSRQTTLSTGIHRHPVNLLSISLQVQGFESNSWPETYDVIYQHLHICSLLWCVYRLTLSDPKMFEQFITTCFFFFFLSAKPGSYENNATLFLPALFTPLSVLFWNLMLLKAYSHLVKPCNWCYAILENIHAQGMC